MFKLGSYLWFIFVVWNSYGSQDISMTADGVLFQLTDHIVNHQVQYSMPEMRSKLKALPRSFEKSVKKISELESELDVLQRSLKDPFKNIDPEDLKDELEQ